MHKVLWSSMQINVLLDRGLFGGSTIFPSKVIKYSISKSHSIVDEFHDDWEPDVKDHGAYYGITHAGKPTLVEV